VMEDVACSRSRGLSRKDQELILGSGCAIAQCISMPPEPAYEPAGYQMPSQDAPSYKHVEDDD